MVTVLPPGNNILMLSGYVKQNSSISDFVASGRTTAATTIQRTPAEEVKEKYMY